MNPTTVSQGYSKMAKYVDASDPTSSKTGSKACAQEVYEMEDKDGLPTNLQVKPQELRADMKTEKLLVAYDCFLCLIPSFLIIKTILCIVASRVDKHNQNIYIDSVSRLTIFLVNFNGQVRIVLIESSGKALTCRCQLATAFTIAFVTIMSTMVRRWALYKAQEGAYLGELEQLQASISLPSTAKMIWSLRRWGFTSIGLLFLWCFYYLGSQACKLEYALADSRPFHKTGLAMLNPDVLSGLSPGVLDNPTRDKALQSMSRALISASANTDSQRAQTPYDNNGNPRVPVIEMIPTKSFNSIRNLTNPTHWLDVLPLAEQQYAGYSGPVVYQKFDINEYSDDKWDRLYDSTHQYLGKVNLTAQYFLFQCGLPKNHSINDFPDGTLPGTEASVNMTANDRAVNSNGEPTLPKQFNLWSRWTANYQAGPTNGSVLSICNLTMSMVDVQATCLANGCSAKKVRYNPAHTVSRVITPFDNDTFATNFFDSLLQSMGPPLEQIKGDVQFSTQISSLLNVNSWFNGPYQDPSYPDFQYSLELASSVVAASLTHLVNTYYSASQAYQHDCSAYDGTIKSFDSNCTFWISNGASYNRQYLLSIPWIIVDFASCLVLLGASIFAYWLRTRTLAPDIFGYVSSFTRENPHFDLPTENGSTLSGLERARLLSDVRIKIGEFRLDDGVPRIVVSHGVEGYEAVGLTKVGKYA